MGADTGVALRNSNTAGHANGITNADRNGITSADRNGIASVDRNGTTRADRNCRAKLYPGASAGGSGCAKCR